MCLTSGKDGMIGILDVEKCEVADKLTFHSNEITDLLWKNSLLVSGDSEGELAIWVAQQ